MRVLRENDVQNVYREGGQLPALSLKVYELEGTGPDSRRHLDHSIERYNILRTCGGVGVAILTGFPKRHVFGKGDTKLLPEDEWTTTECCSLTMFSQRTVFDWHFAGGRRIHIKVEELRTIVPVLANFYLKDGEPVDTGVGGGLMTEALHIPGDEAQMYRKKDFDEKRFLYKEVLGEGARREPKRVLSPRFAVEMAEG